MSKVEELKKRVEEALDQNDFDRKSRRAVLACIEGLTDETAGVFLALGGMETTEPVETKNVRHIKNYKDARRLESAPPEDLGIIYKTTQIPPAGELFIDTVLKNGGKLFEKAEDQSEAEEETTGEAYFDSIMGALGLRPEKFSSQKVEKSLLITDKLSQNLGDAIAGQPSPGKAGLRVNYPKRGESILILNTLSDDQITEGKLDIFTEFDKSIYEGYAACKAAGSNAFTDKMIFRAANGLDKTYHVTPEEEEKTRKAIDKWATHLGKIDITEIYNFYQRKKGLPEVDKLYLEGNLLSIRRATVQLNGQIAEAYVITPGSPDPLLIEHAKLTNQLQRIEPEALKIPEISNTDINIGIRRFLLIQIHRVHGGNTSNIITYASIFEQCEKINREKVGEAGRTSSALLPAEKTRIRSTVRKLLDYWKSTGYIYGYKELRTGKEISKIEILRKPNPKISKKASPKK